MNEIWELIAPYVTMWLGIIGGSATIYALCRFLLYGSIKKMFERFNTKKVAEEVVEGIAGKYINVDVTAITENRLGKIDKDFKELHDEFAEIKNTLALICGANSKLKALTTAEKDALQDAAKRLNNNYVVPEPEEVVVIKLEPIEEKNKKGRGFYGKLTKKRIVFLILQGVFYLIGPLVIIWLNYGNQDVTYTAFKWSMSIIILLLLLIWVLKKVVLKKRIEEISQQLTAIRTKVVDMTEQDKLILNRKELNRLRLTDLILRCIMPALVFVGVYITLNAMEAAIIKLSGAMAFIGLSLLLGVIFNALEIITSKLKNEV